MPAKNFLQFAAILLMGLSIAAHAEEVMFEDFQSEPASRWTFIADTVMGGVSTGKVAFETKGTVSFARLTGSVSTENRGGFIQFRRKLDTRLPDSVVGIRMIVRGNGQNYFVHLRTKGTVLPWQYYQSGFKTTNAWREVRVPLSSFKPSGRMLRRTPDARSVTSIGVVAFGRDHDAQVDVREIEFY